MSIEAAKSIDEFAFPSPYYGGNGGHWAKAVASSRKSRSKMRTPPNSVEYNAPLARQGQEIIDLERKLDFSNLDMRRANNDVKKANDKIGKLNREIAEISAELDRTNDTIRSMLDKQQRLLAILREKLIRAKLAWA
jgi:vacuolar-type H+-ATPase subunit I/STV1